MLSQIHFIVKDIQKLGIWKIVYKVNRSHKQVNIAILISDKVDFELKLTRRENINIHFKEQVTKKIQECVFMYQILELLVS